MDEGKDVEQVILNTSSSIYMPPGLAYFPQIWRKVKQPVLTMVIISKTAKPLEKPAVRTGKIKQAIKKEGVIKIC